MCNQIRSIFLEARDQAEARAIFDAALDERDRARYTPSLPQGAAESASAAGDKVYIEPPDGLRNLREIYIVGFKLSGRSGTTVQARINVKQHASSSSVRIDLSLLNPSGSALLESSAFEQLKSDSVFAKRTIEHSLRSRSVDGSLPPQLKQMALAAAAALTQMPDSAASVSVSFSSAAPPLQGQASSSSM